MARALLTAAKDGDATALRDAGPVVGGEGTRLRFAEGATFWIAAAHDEIWLEYEPPLTAVDAAYFLFEPVLAFVLRRRGVLAMHASAVEIAGRAVLFCGPAGSGKSTTAAACVSAGHSLVSDDVVALEPRTDHWVAHAGPAAIRLWDDGVRALGHDAEALPRFSPTWDKRSLDATRSGQGPAGGLRVGLVCVLDADVSGRDRPRVEPVGGMLAFREIVAHTAGGRLHDPQLRADELGQLARLLECVPVARLTFPRDGQRLPDVVGAIRAAIGA